MGDQDNGIGDCSNTVIFCILRFLSPSKVGYSQWSSNLKVESQYVFILFPITFTSKVLTIINRGLISVTDTGTSFGANICLSGVEDLNGVRTVEMIINSMGTIMFNNQGKFSGISAVGY